MATDCFCCVRMGRVLPTFARSAFGKSPAQRTALSTSGLFALRLERRRRSSLTASGTRSTDGSRPRTARCCQYCAAESDMPCSVRSDKKCRSQKRCPAPLPPVFLASSHLRCASRTARWSDCAVLKATCAARASSRRASGERKGDRSESAAAMSSIGSAQRRSAPYRMSRPMDTSTGSAARCLPSGVSCSWASRAPVRCSEVMAAATIPSCG